jgi:hypothetical protein
MNGKQNNFFILTPAAFFREAWKIPRYRFPMARSEDELFFVDGRAALVFFGALMQRQTLNLFTALNLNHIIRSGSPPPAPAATNHSHYNLNHGKATNSGKKNPSG